MGSLVCCWDCMIKFKNQVLSWSRKDCTAYVLLDPNNMRHWPVTVQNIPQYILWNSHSTHWLMCQIRHGGSQGQSWPLRPICPPVQSPRGGGKSLGSNSELLCSYHGSWHRTKVWEELGRLILKSINTRCNNSWGPNAAPCRSHKWLCLTCKLWWDLGHRTGWQFTTNLMKSKCTHDSCMISNTTVLQIYFGNYSYKIPVCILTKRPRSFCLKTLYKPFIQ